MVRVIMGVKGTGKTKQMIELINSAVHSENGNVVCIERGPKLTYDIHYKIRLVEASHYDIRRTILSSPSPSAPMPPWPPTASRNTSDTCPFSGPCRRQGPLPRSSLLPASNRLYIRHTAAELWIIYRLRGITSHDILFGEIKEV